MRNTSRRDFLKLATNSLLALSGVLGIGGLIRFLSFNADPVPQSDFDIGPKDKYPKNSRTTLANIPAVLIRDEDEIRAVSLACSHLGCTIEEHNTGFECPCHRSRYDLDGTVIRGPASADLKIFRVTESDDGNLHVFTV